MKRTTTLFQHRTMIIATKHDKQKVIAPIVEAELSVSTFTPTDFDTDLMGTFTGEIEREHDPISTLRKKCLWGMEKYQIDLGIASEGSFGPHPSVFFIPTDDEWVIMIDKKNNMEIIERHLSTETNFCGQEIASVEELRSFADKALFPTHRLVLRNEKNGDKKIIKGIGCWKDLVASFQEVMEKYGTAFAETDMRAMYNPTRMNTIGVVVKKLVDRIKNPCPVCDTPGFGITGSEPGLPCEYCKTPTRSTLYIEYNCNQCSFSMKEKYPHGRFTEQQMYCDVCNP